MDKGALPDLASADDLIVCYQNCKALQEAMKQRQAGGGNQGGGYKKHDWCG